MLSFRAGAVSAYNALWRRVCIVGLVVAVVALVTVLVLNSHQRALVRSSAQTVALHLIHQCHACTGRFPTSWDQLRSELAGCSEPYDPDVRISSVRPIVEVNWAILADANSVEPAGQDVWLIRYIDRSPSEPPITFAEAKASGGWKF